MIKLIDHITGATIINHLKIQSKYFDKLRGYALRKTVEYDTAMFFLNTRRVHTFGMFFPLNLYYFDDSLRLLECKQNVQPNRIPVSPKGTRHIMEVPAFNLKNPIILQGKGKLSFVFGEK